MEAASITRAGVCLVVLLLKGIVDSRTFLYDNKHVGWRWMMTGKEFENRVKRLGRKTGQPVQFVRHGKGSHGRLYYGNRFTTLKDRKK